jgi:hypothetical protein
MVQIAFVTFIAVRPFPAYVSVRRCIGGFRESGILPAWV